MKKRILCGILAALMTVSCTGVMAADTVTLTDTAGAAEVTVTDTTAATDTSAPADSAAADGASATGQTSADNTYVDVTSPNYTNLDPAKGDLIFRGQLLLDKDGFRAATLEDVVNMPEGFETSPEYIAFVSGVDPVTGVKKDAVSPFPDVETSHKNYIAIEDMKKKGYIVGYEDGSFRPANNVTRAEFVKVLIEKDGGVASVADSEVSGFTDVDTVPPHWAQKYIVLGVKKGYLAGMGDGTFAPDATITYEQAMKILVCHFGKEISAKTIASAVLPLWPNAYVVTGQQLSLHENTNLSMGMLVNRAQFSQMLFNGIKTINTKVNNPVSTGGGYSTGGGGFSTDGGGGSNDDDDTKRISGVIVAINGVCIDPDSPKINNDAFIMLRYNESGSGLTKYMKLREVFDSSNRGGKNMYKNKLGHEVTIKYTEEDGYLEIKSLSTNSSTKETTIKYEDFKAEETRASEATEDLRFFYKVDKKTKSIDLPENLDDMAVVYNGVTIDSAHPSYNHDFTNDTSYIKLDDLLPANGTVKFVTRGSGAADLAIVETYETLVPKGSPIGGVVTDKFDSSKKYTLDSDRLLADLQAVYSGHRELSSGDITVNFYKKSTGNSAATETTISSIRTKTALTIYASRDRTKIDVYVSSAYAGTSSTTGTEVKASYDPEDRVIGLGNSSYTVSEYLINNVQNGKYEDVETVAALFPLGEFVVAYQDSFGEIVDIEKKDPTYTYGYLVDVDYNEGNSLETSYFTFRIITKDNVSKYSNPDNQTFTVRTSGKIKLDGYEYKYSEYEELADALAENARTINLGADGSANPKPSNLLVHATYAQPIRFVKVDGTNQLKAIVTMTPELPFTATTPTYSCTKTYYIDNYMIGSNAVVFSVPDDRFDYDKYSVQTRAYIKQYGKFNPEIYQEETSTGKVNNCVVLYDESITGWPSVESKISIVKSVNHHDTIDDENVYKVVLYQPTSITGKSETTLYVTQDERDTVYDADGNEISGKKLGVGDVIVYGTTKIGTLNGMKNISLVVDVSDREKLGFSKKYERDGDATESDSPYYWYRYGTVVAFDADNDTMYLDTGDTRPELIQGTGLFFSSTNSNTLCKPVYFYANEEGDADIAQNTGDRFTEYTLGSMVQPGDMIFMHASGTSGLQKTVYLIPGTDLDEIYPRDTSNMTSATVTFRVATEGAKVNLDGTIVEAENGTAVFENILPGVYEYTVSADNHKDSSDWLIIRNGVENYTVPGEDSEIELERYTGGVRFIVTPANAEISFSGGNLGMDSSTDEECIVDFPGLEFGQEYSYTITAPGYETVEDSFIVNSETRRIAINMEPILYEIRLTVKGIDGEAITVPATVNVGGIIENHSFENGSTTLELIIGEYTVDISAEGYAPYSETHSVTPDGENAFEVTLYRMFDTVTFSGLPAGSTLTVAGNEYTAGEDGIVIAENLTEGMEFTVVDGNSTLSRRVTSDNIVVSFE